MLCVTVPVHTMQVPLLAEKQNKVNGHGSPSIKVATSHGE